MPGQSGGLFMIESLQWSATDDQLMSSTWTSLRPSTQSHTTSLSPNHKDMDLKGGLFSGYGISWTDAAKVVVNRALCQVKAGGG